MFSHLCSGTNIFIRRKMKCTIHGTIFMNVGLVACFASLNRTFNLSPHENICTIALINIHYLYTKYNAIKFATVTSFKKSYEFQVAKLKARATCLFDSAFLVSSSARVRFHTVTVCMERKDASIGGGRDKLEFEKFSVHLRFTLTVQQLF